MRRMVQEIPQWDGVQYNIIIWVEKNHKQDLCAIANTHCTWARGTLFPVVLLCQFSGFWWEIGSGVTYLRI
jgi:hypothetical protein